MNCPYCNAEMEKGYLQAGRMMLWAKKKHKVSLLLVDYAPSDSAQGGCNG